MKRILILALTILMLAAVLCACGTTAYVDDPYRGYSNVSTTRDGTVNGTNGYSYNNGSYAGGYAGTNGYANGYANGGMTGYANGNSTTGNGTTTTTTTGTARSGMTSGTGMAGGQ